MTWPHRVGVVPVLADCRVERTVDAELDAMLGTGDSAVVVCQILAGLGGVGKTQLAASLAQRWWDQRRVDLLVWVNATSRADVLTRFAQAAADVTGVQDREPPEAAQRFLAWLAASSVRWLIVLDDLIDPGDLRGLWPPATASGRVVVTTRRRDAALLAGRQLIDVDLFTPQEAVDYLRAKLGDRPARLVEAEALAEDLGHLPLALTQAAVYIADQIGLTCAGYRQRLARRPLVDMAPTALPDDHRTSVAGAWQLSIDLADQYARGLAVPLLQLAAVLDPNAIPVEVFTTTAVIDYCGHRVARAVDADDVMDTVRLLHRLSLAAIDASGDTVRVHRLLQRLTREAIRPDHQHAVAVAGADALQQLWPDIERDAPFGQLLRTNALALHANGGAHLWSAEGAHPILFRIGNSLGDAGLAGAARDYFRQLCDTAGQHLGPDHPQTLMIRYNVARSLGRAGDPAAAAASLRQLLADLHGVEDAQAVFDVLNVFRQRAEGFTARVHEHVGSPMPGLEDWLQALNDRLAAIDPRLNFLGSYESVVFSAGGASDRAAGWDPTVIAALSKILDELQEYLDRVPGFPGRDHPGARAVRDLASIDVDNWDADVTVPAFQTWLDDMHRMLGPDDPLIPIVHDHLVRLRGAGDPAERAASLVLVIAAAITCLVRYIASLVVLEVLFSFTLIIFVAWLSFFAELVGYRGALIIRAELARWLAEIDHPGMLADAVRGLVDEMLDELGPDHPATLTARGNLAHLQGLAGDALGALTGYRALLADRSRVMGADHPATLTTMANLARWWGEAGNPASAATALSGVVDHMLRILGPDHPTTLTARSILAHLRWRSDGPAGAADAYQSLLTDQLRVLGPEHPDTLNTRHELAFLRGASGDPAGAVTAFQALLTDYLRVLAPDHPHTLTVRNSLAIWQGEAGDPAGAVSALRGLYSDRLRVLGPEHPDTLATRDSIAHWQDRVTDLSP